MLKLKGKKAKESKENHVVVQKEQNEDKEEEIDEGEDENEEAICEDMEMEESNFGWGAKDPRAGGVKYLKSNQITTK